MADSEPVEVKQVEAQDALVTDAPPLEEAAGETDDLKTGETEDRRLKPEEENWIFYMYAGIPWYESKKITDEEERRFLLARCWEMKMAREAEQEKVESREREMEDKMLGIQSDLQEKMGNMPTNPKDD